LTHYVANLVLWFLSKPVITFLSGDCSPNELRLVFSFKLFNFQGSILHFSLPSISCGDSIMIPSIVFHVNIFSLDI